MVAEAAVPKSKQHATKAAKARREEMIREQLEKEAAKADGAAITPVTSTPAPAPAAASQ